jgi:hypothetical protein
MAEITAQDWQELIARLARIETLIATERERCPYREEIAHGQNNERRIQHIEVALEQLEECVVNLRVESAKAGAYGGLVVSAVSIILAILAKALGWF